VTSSDAPSTGSPNRNKIEFTDDMHIDTTKRRSPKEEERSIKDYTEAIAMSDDNSMIPLGKAATETFELEDQIASEFDPFDRSRFDGNS
jgi:hypothetical protein